MFTRKALGEYITGFKAELMMEGIAVERIVLFGSYAKGNPREESDIDLAIWSPAFMGERTKDIMQVMKPLSRFPRIEPHMFPAGTGEDRFPFLEEVLSHGIEVE